MDFPEDECYCSAEFTAPIVLPLVATTAAPLLLSPKPLLWLCSSRKSLGISKPSSVFDGVTYTRWWLLSIWQPWNNERSVPVLGSCSASNIFLLFSKVSWKQQCLKKANEGDCRGGWRPSSNHPSFYRWAEASALGRSPWNGHQDPQPPALIARTEPRGTAPTSHFISFAFPPPFLSCGFSSLIKFLVCRYA